MRALAHRCGKGCWRALLPLLFAFQATGWAQSCAWLNAATAGGLLGGEVSMHVAPTSPTSPATPADTTCTFTLKQDPSVSLEIAVHTLSDMHADFQKYAAQCAPPTEALRGIGNEAVGCAGSSSGRAVEQIVSRVRNRAFVLAWSVGHAPKDMSGQDQEEMHDKLRNVAEQVAGSLF